MQREPGVRRTLADPAVGDGVPAEVQAGRIAVELAQVVVGLEGSVIVGGLRPRHVLGRGHVPAALRLLLRQMRRCKQPAGELIGRADIDQVEVADGGQDLVAECPDRAVLLLGAVGRRLPLRHVGDHVTRVEFPLLAAAVEQLDVAVPVQLEVPVGVCGEPVVVAAVQDHGVVGGDAALGEQLLEALPVHEVPADRILQVLLPVQLDSALDVALAVCAGVLVHFDQDQSLVVQVRLRPVGIDQNVGTAHISSPLSALPGARYLAYGHDTSDDQVQLAAQADAEGSVQERGYQAEGGGGDAKRRQGRRVADYARDGGHQANALREPRRRLRFKLLGRRQPRPDERSVHDPVRRVARPEEHRDGEHHGLGSQQPGGHGGLRTAHYQRGREHHGRQQRGEPQASRIYSHLLSFRWLRVSPCRGTAGLRRSADGWTAGAGANVTGVTARPRRVSSRSRGAWSAPPHRLGWSGLARCRWYVPHALLSLPFFPICIAGNVARRAPHRAPPGTALRTALPSAAMTSAFLGWPLARWVTWPPGPSTNVVGVRRTSSLRTRSSLDSASISTCRTPSTIPATSARICLVARHGAQKAEENCSRVARTPSAWPSSAAVSSSAAAAAGWPTLTRPLRIRQPNPIAVAAATAAEIGRASCRERVEISVV